MAHSVYTTVQSLPSSLLHNCGARLEQGVPDITGKRRTAPLTIMPTHMNTSTSGANDGTVDRLISVSQAARLLAVHISNVRRWIRQGKLPAYRVSDKGVRVRYDDLMQLLTPLEIEQEVRLCTGNRPSISSGRIPPLCPVRSLPDGWVLGGPQSIEERPAEARERPALTRRRPWQAPSRASPQLWVRRRSPASARPAASGCRSAR